MPELYYLHFLVEYAPVQFNMGKKVCLANDELIPSQPGK